MSGLENTKRHFVKQLSSFRPLVSEPGNLVFGVAGHLMSVPKIFKPAAHGGSYPEFQFHVLAPEFKPRPKREKNDPLFNQESYASLTQISMHQKNLGKTAQSTNYRPIKKIGEEYGLTKSTLKYADDNGTRPPHYQYTAISNDGEINTLIECQYTRHPMCTHEFILDGWTYRFHHSPALLYDGKRLQNNLSQLVATFIEKPPS